MNCTKLLATMAIFAVLLTAIWALADITTKQNADADAQMMGPNNPRMATAGNMTSSMFMKPGQNITSSINLMDIIHQAIGSKVNVSLSDAATTAEGSVGDNSHAVAAHIDEQNGYLVYNVMVIDPSMNFSKVTVDPGNGQVLSSKQISKEEHMRMHGMMGPGMMGPGMMGPGMMGPGMMGPGMMGPGMMGHNMMMGPIGGMMGGEMMGPMHQGMMMGGYPG